MKAQKATELGEQIGRLVSSGEAEGAYALLAPVLAERTPFAKLDLIGEAVGAGPLEPVNGFLEEIGSHPTEGGWVIIGRALGEQLGRDLPGALERCRQFIVAADVWYGADILAERVPGPALVASLEPALELLAPWRKDKNVWIRRAAGIAVHYWAKRSRGVQALAPAAQALLEFLAPMFWEWDIVAVKGIGWGLKTLGRTYPDLLAAWLAEEVLPTGRRHRPLMLRKALTYLPEEQRARALGDLPLWSLDIQTGAGIQKADESGFE
jgi:3-methyladenine DNA glycosylase AlkD